MDIVIKVLQFRMDMEIKSSFFKIIHRYPLLCSYISLICESHFALIDCGR